MYSIVARERLSETTFLWEIHAPDVAASALPGHFVMLRLYDGGERIPLTVADYDRERGTVTIVVQALGKTTREMRDRYRQGDAFSDFVGPLGQPQRTDRGETGPGHMVFVGGGLGVAPVFPQLRAFKQAGAHTTAIMGFRTRDLVFWEEKFRALADELIICTDDGSYGEPGQVTGALARMLKRQKPDEVIAIGPLPMMRACVETTRAFGVKTMVSLNTIMVDGTGMCGSCRVTVGGEIKFACVDGPDFDGHQVDFVELIARQKRFKPEEEVANKSFDHVCNLEKALVVEGKRNYKKYSSVDPRQTPMPERDAHERAANFREVNLGYSESDAYKEAERCIQCVEPTCIAGCPVGIDIPAFIRRLLVRDLNGALETIYESSLFPSICGRVCPQETQCEAQCIVRKYRKHEPVAIGRLERFIGDNGRPPAAAPPAAGFGLGAVAIIGSGPAGLAAAADLTRFGAHTTVYEALHVLGGVLKYGIPSFRLPRDIIDREIQRLKDMGVIFEINKVVGKTFTIEQLLKERGFDAVFIAAGAGAPAFLGIPGEFAGRVYSANEFLTRINLMGGDRFPYLDTPISLGKSVVVIGAGNTAMDCLRVARRIGAETVRCVYRRSRAEAPARVEEIRHAEEEGIDFLFLHSPVEINVDGEGDVRSMRVEKMELAEPDERGRRKPVPTGECVDLDCDTVIYALGNKANPIIGRSTPGLALTSRGNISADDWTQATNLPGVFAGGDIVTGGATVILAMSAGRRAAKAIAGWLKSGKRAWPVETADIEALTAPPGALAADVAQAHCPKCHQPLDDSEPYICCADAHLQWRCDDCAKVSEAFAFPYGMCPHCGGKLRALDRAGVTGERALAAIREAFEIELGGHAFYERAARETDDAVLRDLFGKFAQMEREHMATLSRRYHVALPENSERWFPIDRAALLAGIEGRIGDPDTLFRAAIAFERRAVEFFQTRAEAVPAVSVERQLYRELGAEEGEHVALLQTELARWRAGKPGLLSERAPH
ncbi:sulfide dehydrogenase (flavoprotein) subunit SudA /sulfide dehydrogenase (flavoprotein) subunit SudB [Roseiarcus fermentans]|uniref:Sulfide dehydrogenase (Flavoprotein) subunit SudA /sulfide dehydrogenase (Flavoprotein) subunit SudB n=1 Tax=Roseiarcus fermentans TaxID=1473586 RepID=A0A366EIN8_9HYPH|nr:NADPH-dependent glutamate synthase [Roseiarcus fermentans]RBP02214.1 sulfide dehydrogenase (flavoprotein) subunit SudA /sulfide dehydrogenase (flavoprotein) subunit SudB [Roseiarcus fermentans]